MAFDIDAAGGWGSGRVGNVTDPKAHINAYASITSFSEQTLNLALEHSVYPIVAWDEGCIGSQIMIHALACKNGASGYSLCGRYLIATVTDFVSSDQYHFVVTIDKSLAEFTAGQNAYYWQAITIPEFNNLTLSEKNLYPPLVVHGLSDAGLVGGLLVFKCKDTLTLAGGNVKLSGSGFASDVDTSVRPLANHESTGTLDTDKYSGCENSITKDKLLVNVGDGACFIMAKNIVTTSSSSRIGNPSTSGVQYCRGASDSTGAPANVTNVGGSTIAIVCNTWTGFTPAQIAKYRTVGTTAGRGLARAYLAVNSPGTNFIPDEGLYALDCLAVKTRVRERFNISDFGNGSDGNYNLPNTTPAKCWNSYAAVKAISGRLYTLQRFTADAEEFADFTVGRLVMIHQRRKSSATDYTDGDFKLSRITAVSGSTVTIKHNFDFNLSNYYVQMIVVPEFNNLTLGKEYKNALGHSASGGYCAGGIFAIAVKGTCNLSGGVINMEAKGTFNNVRNVIQSNYYMKRGLPLGQGHGSVFILAKNLTMNTSTRLGATYDGAQFGGRGGSATKSGYPAGGGWKGTDSSGGDIIKPGGWGGGAGIHPNYDEMNGGWHSNAATSTKGNASSCQGAHILIVADTITGLNLSALSTGGSSGLQDGTYGQQPGGCGYGGGGKVVSNAHDKAGAGGYRGGGAGSDFKEKITGGDVDHGGGGGAGACFVYANNIVDQNTTGLVLT